MSLDNKQFLIYACGGHAKVIIHTIKSHDPDAEIILYDDDEKNWGKDTQGYTVVGGYSQCVLDIKKFLTSLI